MSQPNYNLPNGIPPQFGSNKQIQEKPKAPNQYAFNGLGSSHSSRDSSPSSRLNTIPASHLPPTRTNIPPNQLPPNINQLTQNYAQMRVASTITPISSPKPSVINTSTPILNQSANVQSPITSAVNFGQTNPVSPIVSTQSTATNQFNNIPLNAASVESNKSGIVSNKQEQENSVNTQQQNLSHQQVSKGSANYIQPVNQRVAVPNSAQQTSNTSSQINPPHIRPPNSYNGPSQFNQQSPQVPTNQITPQSYLDQTQKYQQNLYQRQMPPASIGFQASTSLQNQPARTTGPPLQVPLNTGPVLQQNASQLQPNNGLPPPSNYVNNSVPQNSFVPQQLPPAQYQGLKTNLHTNRYPVQQQYATNTYQNQQSSPYQNQQAANLYQNQGVYPNSNQIKQPQQFNQNYNQSNVTQSGFNKLWGSENFDLLQCPNILPPTKVEAPKVSLGQDFFDEANCSPDVFRCTMTKIPENNSLLQKSRLPLGVLIHPFKDLNHLPVIQCTVIVRCRACRTYINPFVFFIDSKRWKCNLCYRVNELPEEFQYDPVSKTYGDPSRRPEIKSSTIEYIAPAEYMLRPPQPAVYLFLLDISRVAIESGYLHTICNVLAAELINLPGDARTQIGIMAYDSSLHFFALGEGLSQPHEMTILDIDDVFLPCPDNLLVNLKDRMDLVADLLTQLPTRYDNSYDNGSALGAALQAAHKMMSATGGRVTVFQASLPTIGPGALLHREDPNHRASSEAPHLNPANDFYKRLALECSGQQIAVDLFIVNSQYVDIATISGISRFSGGCIYHFPLYKASRTLQSENLERCFRRYLTRKIGFEAVMRIRCTRGLSIHTFHGNFFVRSTDLLSLPNINPDAGFGMQVSIDDSLSDVQSVCFQAALLYTSSKGERRIRVHTLCLPVVSTLSDVINAADQQCIIGLLGKMAVDRSMQSSLSDAREAFINVAIDILSSYKLSLNLGSEMSGLLAPQCLKLLPLYISALLKYVAFRTGTSTRLDDRVKAMCDMKTRPLYQLIQVVYPDLYPVHNLEEHNTILNENEDPVPVPPHLQLTARSLDSNGAYLMDIGEHMILFVCPAVSTKFLNEALNISDYNSISDQMYELPLLDNSYNQRLNNFINYLNDEKPFVATLQIIRENSANRNVFIEHLIEDRIENALSYHEFLQHLKTQVK